MDLPLGRVRKQLQLLPQAVCDPNIWSFPTWGQWKKSCLKNYHFETSLVVQWLRLHPSTAGGINLIPGWGTKIPHVVQSKNKTKQRISLKKVSFCIFLIISGIKYLFISLKDFCISFFVKLPFVIFFCIEHNPYLLENTVILHCMSGKHFSLFVFSHSSCIFYILHM